MPIRPEIAQTFCPQTQATVTFCQLLQVIYDSGKPSGSHGKAAPHRRMVLPMGELPTPVGESLLPYPRQQAPVHAAGSRIPPFCGLPVPVCTMMHRQQRDHGKAPESGSAIWPRQGWCCFARAKPALFSSPHPQPPARQHVPCISRLPAAETNDRTCGGRGSNGIVTSAG